MPIGKTNPWRGSLLPLGREAAPKMGLRCSPAGASSLATSKTFDACPDPIAGPAEKATTDTPLRLTNGHPDVQMPPSFRCPMPPCMG